MIHKEGTHMNMIERNATSRGSHMPLDTDMHWDWRNPLNIIPALILLNMIVALIALLVS
jgi:hypothetical protein